jgi:uncharacterized protein with GYD domain
MKSLMLALPLIAGLAVPAMAEDMHRYITVFKYSDTAMKAMTENPQDRGAAAAKLAEAFGGKMEAAYWFSSGGDYDGMVVWLLPNDQAAEALNMMTRASGNFSNTRTLTAMTAQEFKESMEKAKTAKSGWTPPTATGQK